MVNWNESYIKQIGKYVHLLWLIGMKVIHKKIGKYAFALVNWNESYTKQIGKYTFALVNWNESYTKRKHRLEYEA